MLVVRKRQKIRHRAFDYAQAMPGQPEIGDHLGMQQAHRVAGGGIAKAGEKFLRDGRAANDIAPFDQAHFQPRASQITGAHQTIVASADDHRVEWSLL